MIYVEDERIKLNGVVLPGLLKSIEVTESAKVDEQEVEGSATKPKQATGYEDAKVNIELILDDTQTQTKYERYEVLRAVFRSPGQEVPQPIPIVSEDTAAHGIEKVIFKKLTHRYESKKSQLTANLELWEYIPQTITAVRVSGSGTAAGSRTGSGSLNADYQNYLGSREAAASGPSGLSGMSSAISAGLSVTNQKYLNPKLDKSPAFDSAGILGALDAVSRLPF